MTVKLRRENPPAESQESYRAALESFYVSIPDGRHIDYRTVVRAIDSVHCRTSGRVSSRGFLLTGHSLLNGRAPIDVISEPDGPEQIWRAAEATVKSLT